MHAPRPAIPAAATNASTVPGAMVWRPQRQRGAAAAGAGLVTLLALCALWAPPARHPAAVPQAPAPTWLRLLPLPATPAPPVQVPQALPRPDALARLPRPRAPALPTPDLPPQRQADPQPITLAAPSVAAPPAPAASRPPPLRLGDEVLRRAARDSIAETRRLAAEAGLPAERDASAGEQLADAVQQSAKPDCLGPNPGGSLLSIPLIAWDALRQKCK